MAARRKGERIEPSFGAGRNGDGEIRLSADDRAVPAGAGTGRPQAGKAGKAARSRDVEANGRAPQTAARRGFFGGGGGGGKGGAGEGGGGRRRRRSRGFLGRLVRFALFTLFWGVLALAGVVGYFAAKLPQEAWAVPARPPNVKILSVNGDLLANRGLTGGEAVPLARMSPYLPKAVVAIEDRRFYSHYGIDPVGILRAFGENLAAGQTVQGGSTLTQQLAKNIFLKPEQTLVRKIQEAILSVWLEGKFSKNQILELYLNRVYFGSGATGVEAASRRYFNKSAADINLGEAALLAGLLKAPSRLSPARDPEAAMARAAVVLQAMLDGKAITRGEFDAALAQKTAKAASYWSGAENYAADIVMRDLQTLVGPVDGDVVVETTIDLGLEKSAEGAIRSTIDGARVNASQGALVAVDGTGAIRALVGGRDYADSQFNRAVDARRQPGSAFKPFVYMTALEYGWRPESVVNDAPTRIGDWTPANYDRKFRGPVTLADALAHSLNTVAAQLTADVGAKVVIDTAARMGITTPLVDNASIALGTSEVSLVELTGAYAPFANGGYQATPHLVNRVTGADGKVLYERGAEVPPVIVTDDIVAMMNAMLTRTITDGTGRKAALKGWQAAGKTGTTQDSKDAWFLGYTANLTTGVWIGNDNGAPMKNVTGGGLPAEAWHAFMEAAHQGLPAMPLPGGYRIGEEPAPLTASNAGDAVAGTGGFNDSELAPVPGFGAGEPGAGGMDDGPGRGVPDAGRSDAEPGSPGAGNAPPAFPEETYDTAPLPPEEDIYGSGMLPPIDSSEEADQPRSVRRGRDPEPVRGPSRIVRRGDLPPGAILEGPVESGRGEGRPGDRSLFRQLFGG